jgi:hypothetical protein
MLAVGLDDEAAGGGQIFVAPSTQFKFSGQVHAEWGRQTSKRPNHEEAPKDLKAGTAKKIGMGAGGVEEQLRFNTIHLWRVEQQLKKVPQQRLLNFVVVRAGGKDIADDGLGLLVNA